MYGHPSDRRILLAENPRTSTKAKIKRASAAAQREATSLVNRDLKQLRKVYAQAAAELKSQIHAHQNGQGLLTIEVLQPLLNDVNKRIELLGQDRDQLLNKGMQANADAGTKPFAGVPEMSADLARVSHEAVQFVQTFVAADGLQLSDRLWRLDRYARETIGEALEQSIIQGYSATRAAQELLERGQPVPADLAKKMGSARAEALGRIPGQVLMTGENSAYYQAERVFRTEINRAHVEAYRNSAYEHPEVIGTKFLLSPRHPKRDICDMHASANIYGLGPGVYPKGKSPLPAHPNTLSYEVVVFADEVTKEDRAGRETRVDWLKNQPAGQQISILGPNKANLLQRDLLKENEINAPWSVVRKRIDKLGISIPKQASSGRLLPGGGAGVVEAVSVGEALDVVGYKTVARNALAAIDLVHRDGILPKIPVKRSSSREWFGAYHYYPRIDTPADIRISSISTHKEHTLVHEIGHFLDHKGLPGAGFTSEKHELLAAWRTAVRATPEYKQLEKLRAKPYIEMGGYRKDISETVEYYIGFDECFARSYAQWVTLRSGDRLLQEQLDAALATQRYPAQWQHDNFEPVARALDTVFEKMGWINAKK